MSDDETPAEPDVDEAEESDKAEPQAVAPPPVFRPGPRHE